MEINLLSLFTNDLSGQIEFYAEVLGLKVLSQSETSVTFQVGTSSLEFIQRGNVKPYHFAINIPSNKTEEALNWLKSRVDILKDGDQEIQPFVSWNAEAIYFYDADHNIGEFIARKNLNNPTDAPFGGELLLEISEIGIPTDDIRQHYDVLHNACGLEIYSGALDRFCAIGSETGLFICINKDKKDWFPTNEPAHAVDFGLLFNVDGIDYKLRHLDGQIEMD